VVSPALGEGLKRSSMVPTSMAPWSSGVL